MSILRMSTLVLTDHGEIFLSLRKENEMLQKLWDAQGETTTHFLANYTFLCAISLRHTPL